MYGNINLQDTGMWVVDPQGDMAGGSLKTKQRHLVPRRTIDRVGPSLYRDLKIMTMNYFLFCVLLNDFFVFKMHIILAFFVLNNKNRTLKTDCRWVYIC